MGTKRFSESPFPFGEVLKWQIPTFTRALLPVNRGIPQQCPRILVITWGTRPLCGSVRDEDRSIPDPTCLYALRNTHRDSCIRMRIALLRLGDRLITGLKRHCRRSLDWIVCSGETSLMWRLLHP